MGNGNASLVVSRTITPELVTSRKIARAGRISAQYVGIAQLVERRPSKSDAAGSSPVSHSIWGRGGIGRRLGFRFRCQKRVGSTPIVPTIWSTNSNFTHGINF